MTVHWNELFASRRLRAGAQKAAAAGSLALGAIAAGAAAAAPADDALETHRQLWASAGLDDYEYGYNKFCECHPETPPETLVTVRDGEVVGVRHRPYGFDREVPAETRNLQWYWTVEGLFDLIAAGLDRNAQVRAEYDSARGYPMSVYIDYDADLIGDEVDVRLTRLTPLAE